ncbi:hypothetical protein Ade02nite_58640 [Paractinoplanes deccanensis]|uniref:Uncharacterized protein n=1 Tax=Paractinoplanes deccanensis TaxID=113561 RepID=A0ABQ3YB72_9ACTN|nr:hypothetical protein Ade02nite_58640 [Actinoplanes deccanensis]
MDDPNSEFLTVVDHSTEILEAAQSARSAGNLHLAILMQATLWKLLGMPLVAERDVDVFGAAADDLAPLEGRRAPRRPSRRAQAGRPPTC